VLFVCKCVLYVYCTVLYFIVLYCTVLYCTLLYCIVLYCTVLYCTVLYCTVLYCTLLYCTLLYCIVLYCTVLYCTIQYYTVLYRWHGVEIQLQLTNISYHFSERGSTGFTRPSNGYIAQRSENPCFNVGGDSAVGIATRYGLDGPQVVSRWRRDFRHPFRPALGPNQLTIH